MKYTPDRIKKICDLVSSDDYKVSEICKQVGLSEAQYYEWKANKPEFAEALKKAEEKRLETFKQAARSGLLTLLKGKVFEETKIEYGSKKDEAGKRLIKSKTVVKKVILPNPTAVIFGLKNLDPDNFKDYFTNENNNNVKVIKVTRKK